MHRWCFVVAVVSEAAVACPWDYETYAAEWSALPCLAPVAAGVLPGHSTTLWKQKLDLADFEVAFAPGSVQSLDARTVALIHLGRIPEAVETARRRLALTPEAYEAHANLGTALTFSGAHDEALQHIDAALAIDPAAHFGRELVHRRFVAYLLEGAKTPGHFEQADFLGRHFTADQLDALAKRTEPPSAELMKSLEAVVAMLAVYGAGEVSHLWLALGNLALEARLPRTAWAAFERAKRLRHPSAKQLQTLQARLERSIQAEWVPSPMLARLLGDHSLSPGEGGWAGMQRSDEHERQRYAAKWSEYEKLERRMVKAGTEYWTERGAQALFAEQVKLGLRCEVPPEAPAKPTADEVGAPGPDAVVAGLDLSKPCADLARALDAAVSREKALLAKQATVVVSTRRSLEPLAAARARCGAMLDAAAQHASAAAR